MKMFEIRIVDKDRFPGEIQVKANTKSEAMKDAKLYKKL